MYKYERGSDKRYLMAKNFYSYILIFSESKFISAQQVERVFQIKNKINLLSENIKM